MSNYQLYRNTTLGVTLQDTLDEMIAVGRLMSSSYVDRYVSCLQQGALTEQAATKVLNEFDRSINLTFEKGINRKVQFSVGNEANCRIVHVSSGYFKGKLSTYRFCDNVWTLVLKDLAVKDSNQAQHSSGQPGQQIHADKVKFVACDGKGTSFRSREASYRPRCMHSSSQSTLA